MDLLTITGLTLSTHIGVYEWEQRILQKLLLDITLHGDFSDCDDNLDKVFDYEKLCLLTTQYVESNSFKLIETVADKVAKLIKETLHVPSVTVSVSKPDAIKNARNIQVTVTR